MRKKMIPFSVMLLVAMLLSACGLSGGRPGATADANGTLSGTGDPAAGNDTAGGTGTGEGGTPGDPGDAQEYLILAQDGVSEYQIVHSFSSLDAVAAIRDFASRIEEKTGAEIPVYDAAKSAPAERTTEILIGCVDSREESRESYSTLSYSAWSIQIKGQKICVNTYSDIYLEKELDLLFEAIVRDENGNDVIPADYSLDQDASSVSATVPVFEGGSLIGVNEAGSGNFEASFEQVGRGEWQAYVAALTAAGYIAYQETNINGNCFGTYTKEGVQVNLSYYPSKQLFKLVYGEKGYLPSLRQGAVEQLCTPSVTQPGREGADLSSPNGAPGMSYVFQLSDGRYIIVDGGLSNSNDEAALMRFLQEHKPAGHDKPVIAAWFITHAHGDHIALATDFLINHRDEVVLELAAYNFPAFDSVRMTNESAAGLGSLASTFQRVVEVYYPNADTLILHTGQQFWIGDAEIEIFYTPEDFAPAAFPSGNHTSSAFRIRLGDRSVMLLGDCEKELCQFMADVYGEELKSDILQLSHHGYNGACLDLYRYIDPDICFWASDEYRFYNDPRCLGTASGYDFNAWLRDDSIRRREHYHTSADTTIALQ